MNIANSKNNFTNSHIFLKFQKFLFLHIHMQTMQMVKPLTSLKKLVVLRTAFAKLRAKNVLCIEEF